MVVLSSTGFVGPMGRHMVGCVWCECVGGGEGTGLTCFLRGQQRRCGMGPAGSTFLCSAECNCLDSSIAGVMSH